MPCSPQHSARTANAWVVRNRISAGVMQRNRLTYQPSWPRARARKSLASKCGCAAFPDPSGIRKRWRRFPGTPMSTRVSSILSVPNLEVEQRPQQLLVVLSCTEVLGKHTVEHARVVVSARARCRALQMFEQMLPHRTAEPLIDRHAKADLPSREDALWKQLLHGFAQNPFAAQTAHPIAIGQRGDECGEFVIKERRARLDRCRHRHAVAAL